MQKFSIYSYFETIFTKNRQISFVKPFNKRRFLSLIAHGGVLTFVSSSKNSLKNKPMTALLKPSSRKIHRPFGLVARALLLLVGLVASLNGQAQGWEIYFGGNNDDQGQSILQTQDKGYVGVGFSESSGAGNNYKAYVIRTDVDGNEVWSNIYDDGFISQGYSITETPDHGFLVVGKIFPTQLSDGNVYLLKINANGQKQWSKQFGGAGEDVGFRIIPTTVSGGYLIVGTTNSLGNGERDVYLVKVDAQGNQVWANAYGTPNEEDGSSVLEVADGYLVFGTGDDATSGSKEAYLIKVDFNGNQVWSKYLNATSQSDFGIDIVQAADGNIVLAGSNGSQTEGWLLKTDLNGDQIWLQTIAGTVSIQVSDLLKTVNGDLVVAGTTETTPLNSNAFLARFDNDGNQIWMTDIGRSGYSDFCQSAYETADGGFIAIGYNAIVTGFFNDVTLIKAGADGSVYTNHLTGKVFIDGGDCVFQNGEVGLNDWLIKAESATQTFFGTSDANGNYDITIAPGDYIVSTLKKNEYWASCIGNYPVTFTVEYDTLLRNFPMLTTVDCPLLQVDIAAPVAQNCSNIAYTVSYCNLGTTPSSNTTVNVVLDNGLTYTGATMALASQNDSLLVFDIGLLGLDECGSFNVFASSDCNGLPLEAYIVSAHILPDSVCLPVSPNWDMSKVVVNGYCDADSVKFSIKNIGLGDMQEPKGFIVIEDDILGREGMFTLPTGQDTLITLPSNGSTYRLIAEQSAEYPGNSYPTVAVEGCTTTPGDYSTGFVTELQEDENDPFTAVDAQENIENFTDYIILRGYPKGYLRNNGENLIPANTDIEYHVYFQNVSMDTITRLVVRDTLSPFLDISTVAAGASSHPYNFEIYSNGVLRFTFDSLQLLPGGGPASEGFIKFKVSQTANNPTGTNIDNSAAVFMGYDVPFQTATYTHVIGGDSLLDFVVITDVNTPQLPDGVSVSAWPNPFASAIEFEAKNLQCKVLTINVYDINGRLVRQEKAPGNRLRLQRNGLPSGTYAYQLAADGVPVHTGKIMVR